VPRIRTVDNRRTASLTPCPMIQAYLIGLSSTSRFVSFNSFINTNQWPCQTEGAWNLEESRGSGGKGPLSVFLSAASYRCILDNPETGPGTAIGPSSSPGPSAAPTGATRPPGNLLLATSTSSNGPSKYTSTSTPSWVSTSDTGAIVGGVIGGIALIGIIIITIVYIRRQRNESPCAASSAWATPSAPLVVDVLPQSPTEYEGKKALSDDGTFASSFLPGSPVTSVRAYVRVLVPLSY
jgi:hypothetical protein